LFEGGLEFVELPQISYPIIIVVITTRKIDEPEKLSRAVRDQKDGSDKAA